MRLFADSCPRRTAWSARLGLLAVVVLALAGCTPEDGRYHADRTDVERATRIWNDPWVAPTALRHASGRGLAPPLVARAVASRDYRTPARPRDAVIGEIQAAQAAGWELTGVDCATQADSAGGAVASLKRSGGLDEAATAWVLVGREVYSAPPDQHYSASAHAHEDQPGAPKPVAVTVIVEVPHHLDQQWPDPPTVEVQDTCLAGAQDVAAQLPPSGKVLADHVPGKRTKPKDQPPGPRTGLLAAIDQADDDTTISSLGLDLRRRVTVDGSTVTGTTDDQTQLTVAPATTLADTAGGAVAEGWSLTYTGCWASGMTVAELHRNLTGGYTLALRLERTPDPTDPTQTIFAAAVRISTSTEGGPGPGDLDEVTTPCWAQEPADPDAPPAFAWAGTPWFGPVTTGVALP